MVRSLTTHTKVDPFGYAALNAFDIERQLITTESPAWYVAFTWLSLWFMGPPGGQHTGPERAWKARMTFARVSASDLPYNRRR